MSLPSAEELARKKCVPCEGGRPDPARWPRSIALLAQLPGWSKVEGGRSGFAASGRSKNFMAAIDFFNKVAALAEAEGHHPDLHLVGYRNVAIEVWTHAIGGLSENDFILAAKIEAIPIVAKKG